MKHPAILPALLFLASCSSIGTDDALGIVASGLGVAATVAEASGGGSSGGGYRASGGGYAATGLPASSGGYSQRGAFEECQRMYTAAGLHDLARQCGNNATDMSSLN